MDDESIKEGARAVQEVAKASGKAIDAAQKSGSFIAKHIDGTLTQVMGMLEDRLRFAREVRQARLLQCYRDELLAMGNGVEVKPLPLKFAADALEEGALEDVDELQDLWARLLANTADSTSGVEPRRSYIAILREFTPLDATIFEVIYSRPNGAAETEVIYTPCLPDTAEQSSFHGALATTELPQPSDAVKASLSTLDRLGLIKLASTNDDKEWHTFANPTFAGVQLMRAIKRRHV